MMIFVGANEKFTNVSVRAFRKSDASGHHISVKRSLHSAAD